MPRHRGPATVLLDCRMVRHRRHARIRKILANELKPEFIKYIEGGKFIPKYVEVVLSTPDEI